MILHLYLARRFALRFLGLFGAFFLLAVLFDLAALAGRFDRADPGLAEVVRLAVLKAPSGVIQLFAMITILATLVLFRGLVRSSELVAMRAAGRSALGILAAPLLVAVALGLAATVALGPMSAAMLRQYETEAGRYETGTISAFSLSRKGLWLRQGDPHGQTVIFARRANFNATRLSGVTFFRFDPEGRMTRRIEAEFAVLGDGAWTLGPGKSWEINAADQVPDATAQQFTTLRLPSDLSRDQVLDSFGDPATISIFEMPGFIERLELSGFSTKRHRVQLQVELARPLLMAAVVILGAVFSMRHARAGNAGLAALATIIAGLLVYILQDFARILGANGAIPVAAAAWGPPVATLLVALGLLLHVEEG